jgi:hypothetical protein
MGASRPKRPAVWMIQGKGTLNLALGVTAIGGAGARTRKAAGAIRKKASTLSTRGATRRLPESLGRPRREDRRRGVCSSELARISGRYRVGAPTNPLLQRVTRAHEGNRPIGDALAVHGFSAAQER